MQPNGKRGNVTHYINTFMTAAHCASRLGFTAAVVDLTGGGLLSEPSGEGFLKMPCLRKKARQWKSVSAGSAAIFDGSGSPQRSASQKISSSQGESLSFFRRFPAYQYRVFSLCR
jgi:hypothetical protein